MKTFKEFVNEVEVNYLQNYKTDLPFQAYKEAAKLYAKERVKEERIRIIEDLTSRMNEIERDGILDMMKITRSEGMRLAINRIKNHKP